METIVGAGLALALGILIGYTWREHLSRQRRAKYAAEQFERDNLRAQKRNAAEAAARDPRLSRQHPAMNRVMDALGH